MSLINCPECRKPVSEGAKACPGCGFALTPHLVAVQKEKKQKAEQANVVAIGVFFLFVIGLCSGVFCLSSSSSSSSSRSEHTFAEKLAIIERGGTFDRGLASQIDMRLKRLSHKFKLSEGDLAAKVVVSQDLLKEHGVSASMVEIMDGIDYAFPGDSPPLGVSFAEAAAAYVTLRQTHDSGK